MAEKRLGQGEHKNPRNAQTAATLHQSLHQPSAQPLPLAGLMHGNGADFRQILPEHVQGAAGHHDLPVAVRRRGRNHHVILNMLVQILRPPRQHDVGGGVLVDQGRHAVHVPHPGGTDLQRGRVADAHVGNNDSIADVKARNGYGHCFLPVGVCGPPDPRRGGGAACVCRRGLRPGPGAWRRRAVYPAES